MTTAHRPTFDQARAKSNGQRSSIQHERALPGYKKLKVRDSTPYSDDDFDSDESDGKKRPYITKKSVQEMRQKLLEEENGTKRRKVEQVEHPALKITDAEQSAEIKQEEDDDDDGDETSDFSTSSSDEDEEELMKELKEIRDAKTKEKSKKQPSHCIVSPEEATSSTVQKSWRSQTAFHNPKSSNDKKKPKVINDMLKSDFHGQFMDRYFK